MQESVKSSTPGERHGGGAAAALQLQALKGEKQIAQATALPAHWLMHYSGLAYVAEQKPCLSAALRPPPPPSFKSELTHV